MNKRPYKEALPNITIRKIQDILKTLDIIVTAVIWKNPFKNIYSVRIEALKEYGSFGTNGKGTSEIYCLASAYAEFIERLQNLFLAGLTGFNKFFLDYIKNETGFYFFPDEKLMNLKEFNNLPLNIINDFYPNQEIKKQKKNIELVYEKIKLDGRKGLTSVPFYDFQRDKITFIPYNFLMAVTGSNGMAAGNTIAEATFQGICEIYERNAAYIIYHNRLTPPTISTDYLKLFKKEYLIIEEIESKGYKVLVKDFSCGLKLPVIGLLIIDQKNNKYRLNIGSDTNFQIALTRVLTEIFQGSGKENLIERFLEYPSSDNAPWFFGKGDRMEEEINFKEFVKNGTGLFPPSLFRNDFTYSVDKSVFKPSASYERDVKNLIKLAKNLKYDLYIRDVSFLGFPTVYIYMPNVSIFGKKEMQYSTNIDSNTLLFDDFENLLFPFNDFIHDEIKIKKVILLIKKLGLTKKRMINDIKVKDLFRLEFHTNSVWNNMSINYFLILLHYLINDYKNSILFLKRFMKRNKLVKSNYYNDVLQYFKLLQNGKSTKDIPNNILEGFEDPNKLFSYINYPKCPDCVNCNLKHECLTHINVHNTIKINNKFKEYQINQNKFSVFL